MRRAAAILAAPALLAMLAAPPAGAAAKPTAVEKVTVVLQSRTGGHLRYLTLNAYPQWGLATVDTTKDLARKSESESVVVYAFAIPAAPFEGFLDIKAPGLGEFVGSLSTAVESTATCRSGRAEEGGTFKGQIRFHGAGGYGSWSATRAEGGVTWSCAPLETRSARTKDLAAAVTEEGPTLEGPVPFRLFAHSKGRALEFIAWGTPDRDRGIAQFVAVDREWLPGEVAAERWVDLRGASLSETIHAGPGGSHPESATFRPPAPFFGTARYTRRSHSLTGSLGVSFLGLRVRLAHRPLPTVLEDEEFGPG